MVAGENNDIAGMEKQDESDEGKEIKPATWKEFSEAFVKVKKYLRLGSSADDICNVEKLQHWLLTVKRSLSKQAKLDNWIVKE